MSIFEESLKKAVMGLSQSYETAEKDLLEETTIASESVERVTGGRANLALRKGKATPEQTEYTLYVMGGHQLSEIATFVISATGYPIKVVSERVMVAISLYDAVLENKGDIKKYFDQLASSSDSRLILRIAFLNRENKSEVQNEAA
jgi:hypothetical protein